MPNKTIYVSDEDLPIFQRAQELAGGKLSTAISVALRRYVEMEEGRQEGYEEIIVQVGQGAGRKQRFSGVLLGEWGRTSRSGRVEMFRVYRSRKGKFVLHVDRSPDWVSGSESDDWVSTWRGYLGLGETRWGFVQGAATLDVFDTVEELRGKIPDEFYDLIADLAERPAVEDLDI
ncbi:EXLDI protein [Nonomuraea angiospora]|uniref:EXLDI family protein n=2 Tax=Nonomuraea TaxID=83681 RepID=A0A7W9LCU6_9ACTN|nr:MULTISPECIES: EXLDI protein [Nonomuraea]MBB5779126.1 EXLDI family protein [Nonomuraea jabiensis]MBE1591952.1 EXLDI family protein [Nonomuraea angiospora]